MLKKPSIELIKKYKDYDGLSERLLIELFTQKFPLNTSVEEVEIKLKMLNAFYNTKISKTSLIAEMIVQKNIDDKLLRGDLSAVNDITQIKWDKGDKHYSRNNYSFATKYCSFHKPDIYPIYDAYICDLLKKYQDDYSFTLKELTDSNFKNYDFFVEVFFEFKHFFHLEPCSLKAIDAFLWQYGKALAYA